MSFQLINNKQYGAEGLSFKNSLILFHRIYNINQRQNRLIPMHNRYYSQYFNNFQPNYFPKTTDNQTTVGDYFLPDSLEKFELTQRIQYLERKCQYLLEQNKDLKQNLKKNNMVNIKIEVMEKTQELPQRQILHDEIQKKIKKQRVVPKKRRTKLELIKSYECPYEKCRKNYASTLALNLHMRIKHGGGTKKQRKELLKHLIEAEYNGEELPEININLPPNYVQQKKKLILSCEDFKFDKNMMRTN